MAAVNRYDPSRASPFIAYAMVCITGELKRYLRDSSWCLHIARSTKERALQVRGAKDSLSATLGRDPTVAELADHLDLSEDCVLDALEAIGARHAYSLDQPVDPEGMVSVGALVPAPTSHMVDEESPCRGEPAHPDRCDGTAERSPRLPDAGRGRSREAPDERSGR